METARLLADLDPDQRRAVTETTHPLCIIAGAGSGKTRVLTRRIAYRVAVGTADPRHVLALTFTRKAATEMGSRLARLGLRDRPHVGTLHAMAWAQLRIWSHDRGTNLPSLLQHKGHLLRELPGRGRLPVPELASEIEWAGARDVSADDYPSAAHREDRRVSAPFEQVASLIVEYRQAKRRRGVMDFDDILRTCADLFDEEPGFARTQRWRFRHLFVDEYQDVNPLQHRLLSGWLGDRTDLCVVGDPHQAIYRWNGADAGYLLRFAQDHDGAAVVELRGNYRSTPQILHLAGAVLGPGAARPIARRPAGDPPVLVAYGDEHEEARGVARAARTLHGPGTRWDSQAVLVRTNGQMKPFEDAFTRSRIPFRVRTAEPLAGRADIGAALRHVAPGDGHPLRTVVVDLDDYVAEQQTARGRDGQRSEALEALVRLAREYSAMEPEATVGDLRGWLMTAMGLDGPGGVDAVHLVTFHAAKGLEWPVVHIAGLEEGFVPVSYAKTPEAEAEERRLLHVAITRAEQTLRISWASTRTMRDAPVARRPSRYVDSLAVAKADLDVLMTTDPGEGLARSRDALRTAGAADLDRALLDDLRAWRARVARRAGIAPAVVASDRVLSDVARHRPTDRAALGAILGVGPMVVDAHGDDLLEIVSVHAATAGTP